MMPTTPSGVLTLYAAALASIVGAVQMRSDLSDPVRPIERGESHGWLSPGVPRLDPNDPMANSATLKRALSQAGDPLDDPRECHAPARWFHVLLDGRQSRIAFPTRAVCQLRRLKEISTAQEGFGNGGLGEMAAFILSNT